MKNLTLFSLFLLLSLISNAAFCQSNYQEGYVLTLNKDTLRGLIDVKNWSTSPREILFFQRNFTRTRKYTVNEVTAFYAAGEKYVARVFQVDTSSNEFSKLSQYSKAENRRDSAFLKVLVEGKAGLFLFKDKERTHFFIEDDTLKTTELLNKQYLTESGQVATKTQYIGQLNYFWRKYPTLAPQINATKYTDKSLTNLFEAYEKLNNVGQPIYTNKISKGTSINFGLVMGLASTKLSFESAINALGKINFRPSINPTFGVSIELTPYKKVGMKTITPWSFYGDLLYKRYAAQDAVTTYFLSQIESSNTYILDFSYLRFSTAVRYNLAGQRVKYFVSGGFSASQLLKTHENAEIYRYYTFNTPDFTENKNEAVKYIRNFELGYFGGIGAKYNRLSCELRYEISTGVSEFTVALNSKVTHTQLLFCYKFGKTKD